MTSTKKNVKPFADKPFGCMSDEVLKEFRKEQRIKIGELSAEQQVQSALASVEFHDELSYLVLIDKALEERGIDRP